MRKVKEVKQITSNEKIVYEHLISFITTFGYPPTIKELSKETFLSIYEVKNILESLEKKGSIARKPKKCRAIKVTGLSFVREN